MFVLGRKIAAIIHSEAGIIFITFAILELENFLQLGKHLMCDSQTIHTHGERVRGDIQIILKLFRVLIRPASRAETYYLDLKYLLFTSNEILFITLKVSFSCKHIFNQGKTAVCPLLYSDCILRFISNFLFILSVFTKIYQVLRQPNIGFL